MRKNALIIGLGFSGSVLARQLAEAGFSVTAYEKRPYFGGNMYEYTRDNGVRVHKYGPHVFHTNSQTVCDYISKFSAFYPYTHRVLGKINGKLVPIPFNFTSIDALFPKSRAEHLKNKLSLAYSDKIRVNISDLISHPDTDIAEFGQYVFENVFLHYTAKQWGMPASQVDTAVINRVPVMLGTEDRYFSDKIQIMPEGGYNPLFEKLLDHPDIHVSLGTHSALHLRLDSHNNMAVLDGIPFGGPICYCGPLDELFQYSLGALPYRSIEMRFEDYATDYYQTACVINYPNEEEYTRITEFKHMTKENIPGQTTILKEYPLPYIYGGSLDPCYPVSSKENQMLFNNYLQMSRAFTNLYLCGRLAEYRYYNMDAVIERALAVAEQISRDYS